MRKLLLLAALAATCLSAKAQKLEVSIQANTGFFRYSGASTNDDSFLIQASDASFNYTNNPYGTHYALSYGAGVKANWVSKSGLVFGLQTDYEHLRSRVNLNGFTPAGNFSFIQMQAVGPQTLSGQTYLISNFFNVSPYIGYRVNINKVSIDLLPGLDIGVSIGSSHEQGELNVYTNNTNTTDHYTTTRDRGATPNDIRLRLGTAIKYQRCSLNASFANGYTNYLKNMIGGGAQSAHTQVFRFGLGYQIF